MPKFGAQKHTAGASQGNRHPECDVPKRRPETLLQKRRPECDVPECRPKTALQNRRPKCGAGMQEPGREGGNAERNAGGGPGAGATARIRRPKRGAECGGQVWVGARDRGTPPGTRDRCARPERTARNTGPECEPGCVGRSARPGARAGCGGRCARTGVRARSARAVPPGTRGRSVGPECEPGCVGRSARPGARAGCEGGVRGSECGGRSAGSTRKSRRQNPPPKARGRMWGQVWVGARDRSAPPGTRDRSASRGAWVEVRGRRRAECEEPGREDRVVRTGL